MDPLADVLSLLKPRSYVPAGFDAGGEWSIQFSDQNGLISSEFSTAQSTFGRSKMRRMGRKVPIDLERPVSREAENFPVKSIV